MDALRLLVAASLTCALAGTVQAGPGDPFGGDDAGCFPTSTAAARCQRVVAGAVGRAIRCVLACHQSRASGRLADAAAQAACQDVCRQKYARKTDAQSRIDALCPPCLAAAARAQLFLDTGGQLALDNGLVYCAPGVPFGAPDTGFIPPAGSDEASCARVVTAQLGRLAACVSSCHVKRADGRLATGAAEEACEDACAAKFTMKTDAASSIAPLCPTCLGAMQRATISAQTESALDTGTNAAVYCACNPTTTTTTTSTTSTTLPGGSICCEDFDNPDVGVVPCGNAASLTTVDCLGVGGTPVGGGAVCDASGDCVSPPGAPGPCCQIGDGCARLDQLPCLFGLFGGSFFASAVCTPSGACVP